MKDGIESQKYDYIQSLTYSPDSRSLAYVASSDESIFIVKDGVELTKYKGLSSGPIYSPDSKSFAYIAEMNGKEFIVKDGLELTKYGDVSHPFYSSDSKNFIYRAFSDSDNKYFMVKNGVELTRYSGITSLVYSSDGSFAYEVLDKGDQFIMKDDIKITTSS